MSKSKFQSFDDISVLTKEEFEDLKIQSLNDLKIFQTKFTLFQYTTDLSHNNE